MIQAQRRIEINYQRGADQLIRVINPAEPAGHEAQYGPFARDDARSQLIALGVPSEQAVELIRTATEEGRAVLREATVQTGEDGNA